MLALVSSSLTGLAMRMWQNDIMTPIRRRPGQAQPPPGKKSGVTAATRRPAALRLRGPTERGTHLAG
ncbi:hypothetical protein KML003_18360 [Klebsiella quasipneumoniae subsp. similipneumoniae]|nr:hypothetical protein NUKP43_01460 [Klebsiella quasipneumoniae]GMA01713.1 hypothetical protein KML003_18360 [Klebsiella quasipneumoniae subsp. similipneumoniae]